MPSSIAFEDLQCASVLDARRSFERRSAVFGDSVINVVEANGVVYIPDLRLQIVGGNFVPLEAIQEPWTLHFEKAREFQGKAEAYRSTFEIAESAREVCILSNFYSRNFFHWITEELPKVAVLERSGFSGSYVLEGLPAFTFESLRLLGISGDRLIAGLDGPTVFAKAAYTTSIHGWNAFAHRAVFMELRAALVRAAGERRAEADRRIWMSRLTGVNNEGRDVVNLEEIAPILSRYGFQQIDMAALPLDVQIATAHSAELLAGPHGAGFVHSLFMEPGADVIECFSPLHVNPGVFDICRMLRHRYSMLMPVHAHEPYPHGVGVRVEPAHLELALQHFDEQ